MAQANLNSMRTSFSPSPCHWLVSEEAEMAKKVALASLASACTASPRPPPSPQPPSQSHWHPSKVKALC